MLKKLNYLLFFIVCSVTVFSQTEARDNQSAQTEKPKVVIIAPTDRIADNINLIQGKVSAVDDGDTISVQDQDNKKYTIRLQGIDAPEGKQSYGKEARDALIKLILDKNVIVTITRKDLYDRYLGIVYCNGQDVGLLQIKAGMAWHFKRYADEQTSVNRHKYEQAEREAQAARIGLWNDPKSKPPWEYRGDIPGTGVTSDKPPPSDNGREKDKKDKKEQTDKKNKNKNDREYILGPRGGCYYINASGTKTYVKDKSLCAN